NRHVEALFECGGQARSVHIAGEASGDMYAARLASALKQRLDVAIFGMGGPQMLAAGVEIITDYSEVSVVGITEVLKRLPSLTRAMRHLVDEAQQIGRASCRERGESTGGAVDVREQGRA